MAASPRLLILGAARVRILQCRVRTARDGQFQPEQGFRRAFLKWYKILLRVITTHNRGMALPLNQSFSCCQDVKGKDL